jgi:acyl transferase domain-containing protein
MLQRDTALATAILTEMVEAVEAGHIVANLDRSFPFDAVADGYAHLAEAANIGKVVFELVEPRPRVSVVVPRVSAAPRSAAIAVIGMAGRYPEAADLDSYWHNLESGRCSIREVDAWRWSVGRHFDPQRGRPGKTYAKWGGFLDHIDRFDSLFFGISGREAERMDPQQRFVLECCWQALEDAGLGAPALDRSSCGVFLGGGSGDYEARLREADVEVEGYEFMGNEASICAARIAYHLNLGGPSMAIATACSSSLVAIHYACQSLLLGECELALTGGVFISTTSRFHVLCSQTGMLSPSGRLRPFDAAADGFVPGEGVGMLVLAPLERALADRHPIHGVILASGVNQDGKTNGITAPSADSQARLIRSIYDRAGIDPASIGYVECHGTGTPLGDPIEFDALTRVFGTGGGPRSCAIGSVKGNIGHAVTAAGVASVHKLLLAMRHRRLPPLAGFERQNPAIRLADGPFYTSAQAQPWLARGGRRRAAVSSFGFSGTNAHLVLEEPPDLDDLGSEADAHDWLIVLSAATKTALAQRLRDLADWLTWRNTCSQPQAASRPSRRACAWWLPAAPSPTRVTAGTTPTRCESCSPRSRRRWSLARAH